MDEDVPAQHLGEGLVVQVARRRIALGLGVPRIPAPTVGIGTDPRGAVARDVRHARCGAAARVDPLGILAARHLEAVWRAGELHPLHGARRHHLQGDGAAADQVGRAREDLQCGGAPREVPRELRVLRPDRMLGPDMGRDRGRRLVAIAVRGGPRRGIDAQVRVGVDEPWGHEFALAIDHHGVRRCGDALTDRRDLPVLHQHGAVPDQRTGRGEDVDVADQRGPRREGGVGAREGVGVRLGDRAGDEHGGGFGGIRRGGGLGQQRAGRQERGEREQAKGATDHLEGDGGEWDR